MQKLTRVRIHHQTPTLQVRNSIPFDHFVIDSYERFFEKTFIGHAFSQTYCELICLYLPINLDGSEKEKTEDATPRAGIGFSRTTSSGVTSQKNAGLLNETHSVPPPSSSESGSDEDQVTQGKTEKSAYIEAIMSITSLF